MNKIIHSRILNHYKTFFSTNEDPIVFRADEKTSLPIQILLFPATDSRPFQVLSTIGASAYRMPGNAKPLSVFNEYLMFLPSGVRLDEIHNQWYFHFLSYIATYSHQNHSLISYCHTLDYSPRENEAKPFNMTAGYLMFPQAIDDVGILELKIPFGPVITFLQAMPVTKKELDAKRRNGPEYLVDYFYSSKDRFLAIPFRE